MFFVYHHYDLTRLAELQAVLLERRQRRHALEPDTIIVPNPGVGRWLQMQIAESEGVAANIQTPLLARYIWELLPRVLPGKPDSRDFERSRMRWHIFGLLPQLAEVDERIASYLRTEAAEVQRLQLATQLADVFDQYLIYRPTMMDAWLSGDIAQDTEACWQAPVWQALCEKLGSAHRGRWLHDFIRQAHQPIDLEVARLPSALYCFALDALPPDYLKFLYALARHIDVHFLLPNPCPEYWADISRRRWSLDRSESEAGAEIEAGQSAAAGHPLLASLGKGTRDLLRLLYADELQEIQSPELGDALAYQPPGEATLLQRVQSDIIRMQARHESLDSLGPDCSIQIHSCHGALREVQVLHDQLLDLLSRDTSLQARDIAVMMPDVSAYTAAIEGVFGAAHGAHWIPFSISDRSRAASHPIMQSFAKLLELPLSRFQASEVLDLAGIPAVMRRCQLDSSSLQRLREASQDAGVRWGLDASSREQFGNPPENQYSWEFGLDRLLLGFSQSDSAHPIDGVAPWTELEGGIGQPLGQLWYLLDRLRHWRQALSHASSAMQWQMRLNQLLDDFFLPDDEDAGEQAALQELRQLFAQLELTAECLPREPLSWAVVREILSQDMKACGARQAFLDRGVNFCGMVPLRHLPFRVVCLLGMDDGAFPRQESNRSMNLLRAQPRIGDRNPRDDDRLLFLHALMACRDVFYISYTGQDTNSGEALSASTLVGEWMDFLHQHHFADLSRSECEHRLIAQQPMHPFSPKLFQAKPDSRCFSFAAQWHAASASAGLPRQAAPRFSDNSRLDNPVERRLELRQLQRFFDHPARHFLRERLQMEIPDAALEILDETPLQLDSLGQWQLRDALLRAAQEHSPNWQDPATWQARAMLPPAPLDEAPWQAITQQVQRLLPTWQDWNVTTAGHYRDITIELQGFELSGRIHGIWPQGLRRLRPGSLNLKHRLRYWLEYLLFRASGAPGGLLIAGLRDDELTQYQADIDASQATEMLGDLLDIYREGQQRPLLFLASLAQSYLERLNKNEAPAQILGKLNTQLLQQKHPRPETQDPYFRQFLQDATPLGSSPQDSEFCHWAERIGQNVMQQLRACEG